MPTNPFNRNRGFATVTTPQAADTRTAAQKAIEDARMAALAITQAATEKSDAAARSIVQGVLDAAIQKNPDFSSLISPGATVSEKVSKAKELALSINYYDTDIRDVLQQNLQEADLQDIFKKWVNRVVAWNINPNNPGSPYYGVIGDMVMSGQQTPGRPEWGNYYVLQGPLSAWAKSPPSGIVPGKTLFFPEIPKALKFLGGDTIQNGVLWWYPEDPNKDWIKSFIIENAVIAGEKVTLIARDWNKMMRQTVSQLGLDNFYLATETIGSVPANMFSDVGNRFVGYNAKPSFNIPFPTDKGLQVIYPESFDAGKPTASKNVFDQTAGALKVISPILTAIGVTYMTGGLASGLLGGGALGAAAGEKISGLAIKEVQKITAPKPFEPQMITMPGVSSMSFDEAAPEAAPASDLRDALIDTSAAGLSKEVKVGIILVLSALILVKLIKR